MKINLTALKEGEVISVQETYDPKALDLEFVDLEYTTPLNMEGTVERGHDTITFRGELTSNAERICGRCLKRVKVCLDKPFELFYEINNQAEIDTLDDLREVMLLEHPLTFICNNKCKGLCPSCGINLNEETCKCVRVEEEKPGPLASALKKLKIDQKEEK